MRVFARALVPLLALATQAASQTLSEPVAGLEGGDVARIHVDARPGTPVVAIVLALPAGSVADPPGAEGSALVLASAIARTVEAALGPGGARATAEVDLHRVYLTVLVEAARWVEAWSALENAVFESGPSASAVAETVERIDGALLFSEASPAHDVAAETRSLLYGAGSSSTRPPGGTRSGIANLTAATLDDVRRGQYRRSEGSLALVGDLDSTRVQSELGVDPFPAPLPTPEADSLAPAAPDSLDVTPAAEPQDPPVYDGARPWDTGDRVRVSREVTSTWIAVAWPAPDDLPPTLLDFVAHRLEEELNPVPSDPGLFSVVARAARLPAGRILLVEAAVLPDAAERWEARILSALETLRAPVAEEFFIWQRRRFRSAILLEEATPELAALRRAEDLLAMGVVRSVGDALWRLDPETLVAGVAALGSPRILVYGPDLAGNGTGGGS